MPNTKPRRYTVAVAGSELPTQHATKAAAMAAFHAAAVAGRTANVHTPAGHTVAAYLAEQGPVEVVDGKLRSVATIVDQAAELAAARRASTEQAPTYGAHVAEIAAAGGPVADVELAGLADALRGRPRPVSATLPARQLALMPLTPDEDGAQLDLFEAAAEATR